MRTVARSWRLRRGAPCRARRGANAIEFALTLPIFLAIVLGLMDYGYLFAVQAGLDNAVSLACREGAITDPKMGTPTAEATADFAGRSMMWCGPGCVFNVQVMSTGQYAYPNQAVRCRVQRNMVPLSGFVPYPPQVTSTSYYRLEWQDSSL